MKANRYGIYEAQRLLRRANELNPDATALAVQAIQQLAEVNIVPTYAMYYIHEALPGAVQTEKERNILCPT